MSYDRWTGELPDHLDESEVRELVAECDTMLEFQREARIQRGVARTILQQRDLYDELRKASDFARGL